MLAYLARCIIEIQGSFLMRVALTFVIGVRWGLGRRVIPIVLDAKKRAIYHWSEYFPSVFFCATCSFRVGVCYPAFPMFTLAD